LTARSCLGKVTLLERVLVAREELLVLFDVLHIDLNALQQNHHSVIADDDEDDEVLTCLAIGGAGFCAALPAASYPIESRWLLDDLVEGRRSIVASALRIKVELDLFE